MDDDDDMVYFNAEAIADAAETIKLIAQGEMKIGNEAKVFDQIAGALIKPGAVEYVANIADLIAIRLAHNAFYTPENVNYFAQLETQAREKRDNDNG